MVGGGLKGTVSGWESWSLDAVCCFPPSTCHTGRGRAASCPIGQCGMYLAPHFYRLASPHSGLSLWQLLIFLTPLRARGHTTSSGSAAQVSGLSPELSVILTHV